MASVSPIERARVLLAAGGALPTGLLAPEIARSWTRCSKFGLDPGRLPEDAVIVFAEVTRRRERLAQPRRLATAQMQLLYEQIAGSNIMIAFADADGVVLDTLCDQHFADSEAGRAIIPGSVWCEERRGTNALGLAVMERAPVAIHGREHYFTCHGHLTCMAVPIFDPAERLVGLLDASCPNEARQQHTHALVRMAAAAVENGLMLSDDADFLLLALHPRAEYLDTLSAGLVAFSPDGTLAAVNRPARALLAGLDLRQGAAFESLFDNAFGAVLDALRSRGMVRLRDRAGSAVYLTCRRFAATNTDISASGPARTPTLRRSQRPGGRSQRSPAHSAVVAADAPGFVCADPALQRALDGLEAAARAGLPVHIHGETGTGKELMAREVHRLSGRMGEFVALNCGAVPETLIIAELFGHERGAYTNARNEGAPGLARLADKGTLFLDEVGEIPLAAQSALLRFLDTLEVRAVGGTRTVRVDVQIVSATNRDLAAEAAARRFRPDLYYRLNGLPIYLPPLRERSDFTAIVQHLLAKHGCEDAIGDATFRRLRQLPWPGNIRELESWIRRAGPGGMAVAPPAPVDDTDATNTADACPRCTGALARAKCRRIRQAYADSGGNVQATARSLGISRTTVYTHLAR